MSKEDIINDIKSKFRILTVEEFMKDRKTYLSMHNAMGNVSTPPNMQRKIREEKTKQPENK